MARATDGASVVFHQAAIPSVARSVIDPVTSNEVNVTGTLHVLVAARDAGSSARTACRSSRGSVTSRRLPERMGRPTVSLRYLNLFGPRQDPRSEHSAGIPRDREGRHALGAACRFLLVPVPVPPDRLF